MSKIYMQVITDQYELPVAVADSIVELSKITGSSYDTIIKTIKRAGKKNRKKYVEVEVNENDWV